MILKNLLILLLLSTLVVLQVHAQDKQSIYDTPAAIDQAYRDAERLEMSRKYYSAAAVYFNVYTADSKYKNMALGKVTECLIKSGLPNAASYFYIKSLQSGDRSVIRGLLRLLPLMLDRVSGDLLRKYLVKYTNEDDYDSDTKNHFYYYLGKDELLRGDARAALQALNKISSGSGILAPALYLKGTAYAILAQNQSAISVFDACRRIASKSSTRRRTFRGEREDLEARCTASLARAHYQANNYEEAEEAYDDIQKSSFVWTDILFEQAWNAYAKGDFNRTLGKLVTYRSPSLKFVFNPEVEVLRAQTFLMLCLYDDVNKNVNDFNATFAEVGNRMKNTLLANDKNLPAFFNMGKNAFFSKLHTTNMFNRAINRFVRGPYFASLVDQERATDREIKKIASYEIEITKDDMSRGFANFIEKVLKWRKKSISLLGGAFVKNSLVDQYQELLADFDKISYIKLDMLSKSKAKLLKAQTMSKDEDGVVKRGASMIPAKDYQYFFTFNGEFWADELGDYVFALDSECEK